MLLCSFVLVFARDLAGTLEIKDKSNQHFSKKMLGSTAVYSLASQTHPSGRSFQGSHSAQNWTWEEGFG
jgi:hypothetical protein